MKDDQILEQKAILENERGKNEALSLEINKIQEEYDTVNQTLSYNDDELEQKKKLLHEVQIKVRNLFKKKIIMAETCL